MRIQIDTGSRLDQSGDTIFAFSDDTQRAIRLTQGTRDECLNALRGQRLSKELRLFAACLYLLLQDYLAQLDEIIIDNEYPGHEGELKRYLVNIIRTHYAARFNEEKIKMRSITKKSQAHKIAWQTLRKRRKVERILKAEDILVLLTR